MRETISAALLGILLLPVTGQAALYSVDTTADTPDANVGDNFCDDGLGQCSLRAAIQEADASLGPDTVNFGIGTGSQTISPNFELPQITEDLDIDATTQPGFAGTPLINLSGVSAGSASGLTITGTASGVFRGLIISDFSASGILVQSSGGVVIEGNYIGIVVQGLTSFGNKIVGNRVGTAEDGSRHSVMRSRASGFKIQRSRV